MGNPVVDWELMSMDRAGVADFYANLFGFTDPVGRMMGLWRAKS